MTTNNRILLVEDNPDDITLTRRALKRHNFANAMDVAHDGEEALARLFDPAQALPGVVLLDLHLPKVDGLEVLQRMRANSHTRHVPVVVLSSSDERRDVVSSYELGANSYVRKPVDFEQFLEVARQLGVYWLVLNLAPY